MKKHRKLKIALIAIAAVLAVLVAGFFVWVSDYYHADETAIAVSQSADVTTDGDLVVVTPDDASVTVSGSASDASAAASGSASDAAASDDAFASGAATASDTALIFYPGAKVEAEAYLPILQKISQRCGITCILVKMPLNLAVLDANAADRVYAQFPQVRNWYIGGHSMGGAMASAYAVGHQDRIEGLILLGAYVYGDYPPADALTVYGSLDAGAASHVDYTDNVVVIAGGNHAQFGDYSAQAGDPSATISREEQQDAAVTAIEAFLAARA